MNTKMHYALITVLVIASLLGACSFLYGPTVKVTKEITFHQVGNYLTFEHTVLEPGMVFLVSYNGKSYQLDRDSINLGSKDGKVYGQINVPMIPERLSAVTLSWRKVDRIKAFALGINVDEVIRFDEEFPDPK